MAGQLDLAAVDAARCAAPDRPTSARDRDRPAVAVRPAVGAAGAARPAQQRPRRAPPARARRTAWSGSRRRRSRGRAPCPTRRGAPSACSIGTSRSRPSRRSARQHRHAVEAGQHQVEDDRGRTARPRARRSASCPSPTAVDRPAFEPEVQRDELADVRLVLDHEDTCARNRPGRPRRSVASGRRGNRLPCFFHSLRHGSPPVIRHTEHSRRRLLPGRRPAPGPRETTMMRDTLAGMFGAAVMAAGVPWARARARPRTAPRTRRRGTDARSGRARRAGRSGRFFGRGPGGSAGRWRCCASSI